MCLSTYTLLFRLGSAMHCPVPGFLLSCYIMSCFAPLQLEGGNNAQLALSVSAVGRVRDAGSILGSVVKILTAAGTITLDDTSISFSVSISHHKLVLFNMLLARRILCTRPCTGMAISSYQTLHPCQAPFRHQLQRTCIWQ